MKGIIKSVKKNYIFVNKVQNLPKNEWVIKPLFSSILYEDANKENYELVRNLPLKQQLDLINKNNLLFESYQNLGPFSVFAKMSSFNFKFVIAGNYLENLKCLELHIMDVDGFYTEYVEVGDLVPINYRDLINRFVFNVPSIDFIDEELVYKFGDSIYVFEKYGKWIPETLNLDVFDFRNLLDEDKWIDQDLDEN